MPIYEFTCQDCGKEFEELLRSASAFDEVECPSCSSPEVSRKISLFAAKATSSKAWGGAPAASCSTGSL